MGQNPKAAPPREQGPLAVMAFPASAPHRPAVTPFRATGDAPPSFLKGGMLEEGEGFLFTRLRYQPSALMAATSSAKAA
jgi:hypothetical protein